MKYVDKNFDIKKDIKPVDIPDDIQELQSPDMSPITKKKGYSEDIGFENIKLFKVD